MEDDVVDRHKKEKKDLRTKIIALKRSSGKKDKKKLQDEIEKMENDLITKHAEEMSHLTISNPVEADEKAVVDETSVEPVQRISKAQKRREKKEQDAKRREEELVQADEDNKNSVRNLETRAINSTLKSRKLKLHSIKSDGDCLYGAISHQLELFQINRSIESLRKIAADYIRAHRDDLICYMTSSKSDDIMSQEEFDKYCQEVEKTKAWGSQIEIQALSNSLKIKIEVLQSSGSPTISGDEYKSPHLIVTYHRHFFGLGEHYNSTRPLTAAADEENDDES